MVPARLVTVRISAVFGLDCPVSQVQAPFSSPLETPCNQTLPSASCQETGEHQSVMDKEECNPMILFACACVCLSPSNQLVWVVSEATYRTQSMVVMSLITV